MATNLGQVAGIVITDIQPTNTNILWKKTTEDIPYFYDSTGMVWLPLNTLGATLTFPPQDPTTVTTPPAGHATWGWFNGGWYWIDDTGTIHYADEGTHQFFTVATIADRDALTDVKAKDRVIVTSEGDNTLNGEYEATVDNPTSFQWLKIPSGAVEEAPSDGSAYVRKDTLWEQGYTKTEIDGLNASFIRVDGTNEFNAGYAPTNPQQSATVKTVTDQLAGKEDYLGLPASNGLVLTSDILGGRTWTPKTVDTDEFINLTDTPASYTGSGGEFVRVKITEDGLIFSTIPPSATTFLALTDTPATYSGAAGQVPVVNALETDLEFITLTGGGNLLSDGSIPMDGAFTPSIPRHLVYKGYVDDGLALKEDSLGNPTQNGDMLVSTVAGVRSWQTPFGEAFLNLSDTPSTYAGAINYNVVVNGTGTGVTFQAKQNPNNIFTGLSDTPSNYVGHANKFLQVNPTANGITFTTVTNVGNLLSDGSVPMDAGWTPVADQDIPTKKYVDDNIGSGNLLSDGTVPMDGGYEPAGDQDIATLLTVKDYAGLVLVSEGTPIPKTGYRLFDTDPAYHGDIGDKAVDMMHSTALIADRGALGDFSLAANEDTLASGRASVSVGRKTSATSNYAMAGGHETTAGGQASFVFAWGQTIKNAETLANYSAILGGTQGTLGINAVNSVMLGGDNMTGDMPETVYIPQLKWLPKNAPATPEEGTMYYDQTDQIFYYWDGAQWLNLAGTAPCTDYGLIDNVTAPTATPDTCGYYTADGDGDYILFDPPTGGILGVTDGDQLTWNGVEWFNAGQAAQGTFVGLTDTPNDYTGFAKASVIVNDTEDGLIFGAPVGGGATFEIPVGTNQGFAIGNPMQYDDVGMAWGLADASDPANTAQGIISEIEPDSATCTIYGQFTWTAHGYTANTWYYLDITAGDYTATQPATGLVQLAFYVLDADTVYGYVGQPIDASQVGTATFLGLGDTPNDYTGQAGKFTSVNPSEDALIFVDPPALTQGWGDFEYADDAGAVPIAGEYTLDNSDVTLVTKAKINNVNQGTNDVGGFLRIVATGSYIIFTDNADPNNNVFYQVDAVTDQTSYVEYDVTYVSDSGTITLGEIFNTQNQAGQPDLITKFTGLSDTPADYVGQARKTVRVNEDGVTVGDGDALEFVTVGGNLGEAILTTVPTSEPVYGDFYVATVNGDYTLFDPPVGGLIGVVAGERLQWNGLIWEAVTLGGADNFLLLTDTPSTYTGNAGKKVVVNTAEDALEFVEDTAENIVMEFTYSDLLVPAPLSGEIRFNNLDPSLATEAYVDYNNTGSLDVSSILSTYGTGDVLSVINNDVTFLFSISDATDSTGYFTFTVVNQESDGTLANNDVVTISKSSANTDTFLGLTDTPANYTGSAGLVPVVNTAEDALEFEAKIEEPTADGLWVRKVTDTATTPVYSWSEELDGGTY